MIFTPRPQPYNFKILDYEFSGRVVSVNNDGKFTKVVFEDVITDAPPAGVNYMAGHIYQLPDTFNTWCYTEKNLW